MARLWLSMLAAIPLASVVVSPLSAEAQKPFVVGNDRGGYLHDRLIELENLPRSGVTVERR